MRDERRNALSRFAEVAEAYEHAFCEVQERLRQARHSRLPTWVFAIDSLSLDELAATDPELAEAERQRRAWRTALHALAEHIALGGDPNGNPNDKRDPDTLEAAHLHRLDRFITVVNAAKAGDCIFVDGRFEPVVQR